MKLLHQATPEVALRVENTMLRRQNAQLFDEAAELRRELAAAQKALTKCQVEFDDLHDLADSFVLTASAERLGTAHEWPWRRWPCHDSRSLTREQAHVVMQQHRSCLTEECTVRATAVRVLRESGDLVPDSSR
ncbi:hypothetical protein [Nocardia brasiliensis]|uniref:hypothetical protein n=1 Tax=Nocardia brasiliensis TaxID=37326 RepID=UPI002454C064|nr:hypothetical protein [Nocardia brasiliensis]